jgi:hypothetical protein
METKALQIIDAEVLPEKRETPGEQLARAQEMATPLAKLIEDRKLFSNISGKKYTRVEGWVPLARFNGTIPREISNEAREDGSYVARVQLVNVNTGAVLTEASAECGGPSEPMWQGRVPNARRSMAATRATGKACRLAYSWIMVLAGYEATPAEEMIDNHQEPPKAQPKEPKPTSYGKIGEREPDTFRRGIKGKKGPLIAISEGQKLPGGYLKDLGAWEYPEGSHNWFMEDNDINAANLEKAVKSVL